ncbi:phage holin [Marinomonas atlantica]|uniref:phage holin n=1 Tax=Marinomonas atlantica TaxID=1806668 RepID=UPI00082A3DD2|nr:phage holin [Marinomonas atlantica]
MEKTNVAANYWISLFTFFTGLSVNEWVAVGGLIIGVATFLTNFWFKREHLKIARQQAQAGENA